MEVLTDAARRGGRRWWRAARSTTPRPSSACCSSTERLPRRQSRSGTVIAVTGRASARGRGVPVVDGHRAGPFGEHVVRVPARHRRLLVVAGRARRNAATTCDRAALDAFVSERRASGRRGVVGGPAGWPRSGCCIVSWPRRACARDDPTADIEGVRVPAGIPHPLSRGRGRRACSSASGQRAGRPA